MINTLEEDEVKWAITADQDSAVKAVISKIPEDNWYEPIKGCSVSKNSIRGYFLLDKVQKEIAWNKKNDHST